ncbi:MAG: BamA/TamA family outer membrane protein [Steroidobacteraceae bacterium]
MRRLGAVLLALGLPGLPAFADVDIGIEGVTAEQRENIMVFLSLERYRQRDDLTENLIESLHDRIEGEVASALRPFGYYAPRVTSTVQPAGNGDWRARILVQPGEPVRVDEFSLTVSGAGSNDPIFQSIVVAAPIRRGDRLQHALYEQVKGDLQRAAATYGYLDARMLRSELLVDPPRLSARIILAFETGQRYHFGETRIEQGSIADELMRRFVRFSAGEPYDATQLLRTQFALDDSEYFSEVEVLPAERDSETLAVPVDIRTKPNRRNRFSYGVGYGSDTRGRGRFTWENRRVNREGHRLAADIKAASVSQSIDARYAIPIGDPALEKIGFDLEAARQELGSLITREVAFTPSITHVRGRWQRVLFAALKRTTTESLGVSATDDLLIPGISFGLLPRGYLGEALFSRELYAELRGSHSAFGSDADFLQVHVQAERVFDLSRRWHLLLRGEVGATAVAGFSELPGTERFFAGGDRSVRGFGFNDLSPVNELGEKVGGRHLLTGSVEVIRDLPRNLGFATFFDFGNAFNKFGDPLAYSAGVGIRWRLPVVTIGIDIAQPLSTRPDPNDPTREVRGGPRFHLNFSPKL